MITAQQQQQILDFFRGHPTAIIATADRSATPGAAVVLFAADDDLSVIFGTHPTRKYKNLKENPKSAMVMTRNFIAVQLHGMARELSGATAEAAKRSFVAKHPEADQHMVAGSVFFRFIPTWLRYLNTGAKPPEMWEVTING